MKVTIVKPFRLTLDDGTRVDYGMGVQEMPDDHAKHWYTKAHTAKPEKGDAKPEKGDAKPEKGDAKPEKGDAKPEKGDAKPEKGDAK